MQIFIVNFVLAGTLTFSFSPVELRERPYRGVNSFHVSCVQAELCV